MQTRRSLRQLPRPPRQHATARRSGRARRVAALSATGALTFTTVAAAAVVHMLDSNITTVDVDHLANHDRPELVEPEDPFGRQPVNVLLAGSDERLGDNAEFGEDEEGMRSDTTMLIHVSADRTRVESVSIPRDSLVDIPECQTTNGPVPPRKDAMFNSALAAAWDKGQDHESAIACLRDTVESLTGVRVTEFLLLDFVGFVAMVDALGGIPMDLPEPIVSPKADLELEAGPQVLDGHQSLGYVRARTGAGLDGSDLSRIDRQQELVTAMLDKVLGTDLMTSTPSLLRFLDAATSSIMTSPGLDSVWEIAGLAHSLRGVPLDDVTLVTVPTTVAPQNRNRVVWTEEADELWRRMAADEPIVDVAPEHPEQGLEAPGEPAAEAHATPVGARDGQVLVP